MVANMNPEENGNGKAPAAQGEGARPEARPEAAAPPAGERASFVTRPEQITKEQTGICPPWRFLSCGIDTLDLAIGVLWQDWDVLDDELEFTKKRAVGTEGVSWLEFDGEASIFYAGGKPPMYRYHFETSLGHIFIGKSQYSPKKPNVYVSLAASALWCLTPHHAIRGILRIIRSLKGKVQFILPSRVDLCADFRYPGGFTTAFLDDHLVGHAQKDHVFKNKGVLETYYYGSSENPVQLRIYNKGVEVAKNQEKNWFQQIWQTDDLTDIWRVEFQIRRPYLKLYHFNSLKHLRKNLGSLWRLMTTSWASLRLPDDSNTTRRTIHPFWVDVQALDEKFGKPHELHRCLESLEPPSADRYINQIAGYAVGYGALQGHQSWLAALSEIFIRLEKKPGQTERIQEKRIQIGRAVLPTKGTYPEGWDQV